MIYVFDTSSFSNLKHFYPEVFKSVWIGLDSLVEEERLISTRDVRLELKQGVPNKHVELWLKKQRHIFTTPSNEELELVAEILGITHFQQLIGGRQRLRGTPVADPFVIACAGVRQDGVVVCEESLKPNGAKIPNVCDHFDIPCINLKDFMQRQQWSF